MKMTVKSGELMNLAKKALDIVFKGLDKCIKDMEGSNTKYDFNVTKTKDVEEDGVKGKYYLFEVGDKGTVLDVTLFKIEDNEDSFMIRIEGDGLEKFEKGPIKREEIEKYVTDYCDKYDLGSVEEGIDVNSSRRLSVTLQRVRGSKEDTINLTAINANYNATEALDDLDAVLSDDDFVELITEKPASFDIVEVDDEYDVQPADAVDTSKTFEIMLQSCVNTYHNLQTIHWGSKGNKFKELHSFIETLIWDTQSNVDTIAEWCVEYTGVVPNVLTYQYTPIATVQGFDFQTGIDIAKKLIEDYISVLECYYVNVEHDVQSVMDDWIRNLKQKSNYFMERALMD